MQTRKRFSASASILAILAISWLIVLSSIPSMQLNLGQANQDKNLARSSIKTSTMLGSSDPLGDEWPMERGALNHSSTITTTLVEGHGLTWRFQTGGNIIASPVISDDKVFVSSDDGKIYCVNATTGSFIWSCTAPVQSSPAIAGDRAFFAGSDKSIYCLNEATSTLLWKSSALGGTICHSPSISQGCVYITCKDDKAYCLNATSGTLVWTHDLNRTGGYGWTAPAIWKQYLVACNLINETFCLNTTTGGQIWYKHVCSQYDPAITDDGHLFLLSGGQVLYCVNVTTGKGLWNCTYPGYISSGPQILGRYLYFGYDWTVSPYHFYKQNMTTAHSIVDMSASFGMSAPGNAMAGANGNFLYILSRDNTIHCFNMSLIQYWNAIWDYTFDHPVGKFIAIARGHLYIPSSQGYLYCLPMIVTPDTTTPVIVITTISGGVIVALIGVAAVRKKKHPKRNPHTSFFQAQDGSHW